MTEKIQKDSSKPHPRINQYPTKKEGLQGIRPTTEDYKAQGVIIPVLVLQSVTHQETQWPWIEICARPPYCKGYCYPSSPCSQPSHLSSFHSYWKQAFHHEWVLLLSFAVQSLWCPTLQPHGLQHARLPCPSLSPSVCSNSCSLSRWCHPTISSSVTPFSSCPQSFPASGSFPMSRLLESGGQSTGASVSASVFLIFFSIPRDKTHQYLFAFNWKWQQYIWTVIQGLPKSPDFSQILKAYFYLDDVMFSRGSNLL